MRVLRIVAAFFVLSLPLEAVAQAHQPILDYSSLFHPAVGANGMVVAQERMASKVGLDILKRGGNAVDAAVAMGFTLAVTLPKAGNIGGGGFMLVHLAKQKRTVAIDYRERAPGGASRDMFLNQAGEVDNKLARASHLSAGVPGTVAGLIHALESYGTLSLAEVLAPAIRLAEEGFPVTYDLSESLRRRGGRLKANPAARLVFFKPGGGLFKPGERFVQKDLAVTLRRLAEGGRDVFYKGVIADLMVAEMKRGGGLITKQDLAAYRVVERQPVVSTYRGFAIAAMPPPSSGGVHVIQMLNILEGDALRVMGHNSAATLHLMAETMKLAYADRSKYLGDPDFVDVPVRKLISAAYARRLRQTISADRARPSQDILPGQELPRESHDTTHFSVMDHFGNAVANTYTLNFSYGSGKMVPGAGFLLNNEMDDFSSKPGVPNAFGLIGGAANAIAPGKRPLSSMTPVILFADGKPFLATGSPGGSTIITAVLQVILNVVDYKMNVAAAGSVPRVHHQWLPDKLFVEPGVGIDTIRLLRAYGHKVVQRRAMGSTQSIMWRDGLFHGASDPRRPGGAALGY